MMNDRDVFLELREVSCEGNGRRWVDGISLAVARGAGVGVVGESGSGKSAVLKLFMGLIAPSGGRVVVDGVALDAADFRALQEWRRRAAWVPPEGGLVSNLTVFENVALPLRYHDAFPEAEVERRVGKELRRFAIEGAARLRPADLPPSERVRAGLARAFVTDPEALFLDEPFDRLSEAEQEALLGVLIAARTRGVTFVAALRGAAHLTGGWLDRAVVLSGGRLEAEGSAEEVRRRLRQKTDVVFRKGREAT
ncbi:MAG: ATP-binding cassette domain-containing protein [Planctomycetota bacterium]